MVAPAVASSASADAEAARLEMARALVAALETQERERGLVLVPTASDLARAAHEKLQYDFPVVSPDELDALAEAMRADPRAFPITAPLVAAAVEGACAPSRSDAAPTATSVAAAARARDDRDDDDANAGEARDARRRAFQRLCATVLVHVPLRAIRSSDADADAAFARYHPRLEASHARTSDDDAAADYADEGEPPKDADADGILDADSDSDWEPLWEQGASRGASHQEPTRSGEDHPALASLDPGARVDVKLVDVLRRAKSACFPDDAPAAAAAASDASFVDLLEALAASDRPNRRAMREVPVALLRDRWARAGLPPGPSAANANASTLPRRFFAALGFGSAPAPPLASSSRSADPSAFGGEEDQDLALGALAHICARHGGAALGDAPGGRVDFDGGGAKRRDPRDAATRDVWRVVDAALAPVAARLERLVAEHRSRRDSNDRGEKQTIITATDDDALALDKWWLAVERCSIAAAFYAALAPGNADVGAALSAGGALRALASLFASPGVASAPRAAGLRRAVARVAASAPDAAAFLGAVPGVRAAVFAPDASPRFRAGGALAAHAAIMALTMRPTATTATKKKGSVDEEEEDAEAACAKLLAPMLVGEEESVGDGEGCVVEGSEVSGAGAPGAGLPPRPRLARGSAASGLAAASAAGLLRGAQIAASRARAAPLWRAGERSTRPSAPPPPRTRRPAAPRARARGGDRRRESRRRRGRRRRATRRGEEEAMYIHGDAARSGW